MKREVKIGIFAVAMIGVAWAGIRFLKGFDIFSRNVEYYAAYDQINGVQNASPIMMKGVKIGSVTRLSFDPARSDKVVLQFTIKRQYRIPSDSEAKIFSNGLMGAKAIEITYGTADTYLQKGDTLRSSRDRDLMDMAGSELDFFKRVYAVLEEGKPARSVECTPEEAAMLSTVSLLTAKPVIYAANLSEADFTGGSPERNPHFAKVEQLAAGENAEVLPICAQLEADIADMDGEEKTLFLSELGLEHSGLDRLIQKSYHLLGLISYLTAGPQEVRAWTITRGTKAPQAAGKIHTDFERGFIRAEIISYEDLMACGSMTAAKEKGLVRSEGKEYVMQDGDVVLFRFNV